jgi:hypothetical protein
MGRKTRTRIVERGKEVPAGPYLRYKTDQGYIKLRWTNPDGSYTEVLEHRVVDGRHTTAEHVHHINHVRDDNRPENLQELSAAEHRSLHRKHALEQYAEWQAMYEAGRTTTEVAAAFGTNAGNVYRGLMQVGASVRKKTDYGKPIPRAAVIARYRSGEGAASIAKSLGLSYVRVRKTLEAEGIQRRGVGRVPERAIA